MLMESEPLKFWEEGGLRKSVVIAFGICVLVAGLSFLPIVEHFYEHHPDFKHILDGLVAVLGLVAVAIEITHAKEANKYRKEANMYRAERNQIALEAKADQEKATTAHERAAAAQEKIAELQTAIHGLKLEIGRRKTKTRLWVRV